MPDTTVYDFPYPAPTDLVRNGPQDFEDLAEKVEETLLAFPTYGEAVHNYGAVDSATNIDLELGPVQTIVIEDDLTLTFIGSPATAGVARSVLLLVKQDATGGRDITYSGIDVWFGEIDPTEWDADEERAITIVATSTTVRAFVVPEAV
jgi:hypothetical protein